MDFAAFIARSNYGKSLAESQFTMWSVKNDERTCANAAAGVRLRN